MSHLNGPSKRLSCTLPLLCCTDKHNRKKNSPFYIIDLSNATKPEMVGELQIPGFSSYLHPITIKGVPLMLGIGEDVSEETGRRIGVKVSLFDVSDFSSPQENATFVEKGAYSAAGSDFYAFRYLPSSQVSQVNMIKLFLRGVFTHYLWILLLRRNLLSLTASSRLRLTVTSMALLFMTSNWEISAKLTKSSTPPPVIFGLGVGMTRPCRLDLLSLMARSQQFL